MIEDESTAAEGVEDQEPQESVAEDDENAWGIAGLHDIKSEGFSRKSQGC